MELWGRQQLWLWELWLLEFWAHRKVIRGLCNWKLISKWDRRFFSTWKLWPGELLPTSFFSYAKLWQYKKITARVRSQMRYRRASFLVLPDMSGRIYSSRSTGFHSWDHKFPPHQTAPFMSHCDLHTHFKIKLCCLCRRSSDCKIGIAALIRHIMLKAPDRAEARSIASSAASRLLNHLSLPEQQHYLTFVACLSRSAKVSIRLYKIVALTWAYTMHSSVPKIL